MPQTTPNVQLVKHTPEPVKAVAIAARLCYAEDTTELLDMSTDEADKLVTRLRRMGHLSPFEHASFTFYIEGVSRAMTHQLVRHRLASYSQRSQRYVRHGDFDYIVPPQLEGCTVETDQGPVDAVEYFRQTMALIGRRYEKLVAALGDRGETSNEDARYVLPNACETKIVVTMNARELLHFFQERLCLRAQWEIRSVAETMLDKLKELCPVIFAGMGPKCIDRGSCPEGKMTCGQLAEVRARYTT